MPTVDLHSRADYASIYYATNTPHYNVSGFDPEKPTLVMLHPAFLDSTWMDLQVNDSRLQAHYNIIVFDMRSSGKSTCRPSGRHDSWVDAADLAFCFQVSRSEMGYSTFELIVSLFLTEAAATPKSYPCPGGFIHIVCSQICGIVWTESLLELYSWTESYPRFSEMCLSLTLVNVPSPIE